MIRNNDFSRGPALLAIAAIFLVLALSGCAAGLRPPAPGDAARPMPEAPAASPMGWWAAKFRFVWPAGATPAWHLDALVAHGVAGPVIEAMGSRIALWRFHRRAAPDDVGHQFSFLFYADQAAAGEIFSRIRESALAASLKKENLLDQTICDDPTRIRKSAIADTADPKWSAPMKRSWPYYIMGVSRMWLELIRQIADRTDPGQIPEALSERVAFFQKVNEELDRTWEEEGRHALLHHLNALFGYGPVAVYEKRYLQF